MEGLARPVLLLKSHPKRVFLTPKSFSWERMAKEEKYAPPQILSTHPASKNRMTVIQGWLPEAQQKRAESACGSTIGYVDEFRRAFGHGHGHGDDGFW